MRLHVISDLHLERGGEPPPVVDADLVVLAGDVGPGVAGLKAAGLWWAEQPVLYVSGNHEPYGHGLPEITSRLRAAAREFDGRLQLLECDETVIEGVRFLGCTLWSDFEVGGPDERERSMDVCRRIVNDYEHIAWTPDARTLRPEDTLRLHQTSRRWLEHRLNTLFDGPTVVITHHGPLPPREPIADPLRRALAGAFISDLSELMGARRVALWIYGHTHRSLDVEVRGTRVVSNPRGYPEEPVADFDPGLVLEL